MDFARHMGETNPVIREIVGEETIESTYTRVYEVETESFVFADEQGT
jgi:hypothetical protein